jgi:transposase
VSSPGSPEALPKKRTVYAQEQDAAERATWREAIAGLDTSRFVFVDEASTTLNMARRYARAPGCARAYGYVPRNYGTRTTIIASLLPTGIGPVMTLAGAADAAAVVAYIEQVLCPVLAPGQIVFMDNLSAHQDPRIRASIEAVECTLRWLPRYSPDYTPIELAFSKLKAFLRSALARTQDELDAAITEALETITATDAYGWFKHCGHILPCAT